MMCSCGRGLGSTTIACTAGDNICQMAEKWQGKASAEPVPDGGGGQFGPRVHVKFREHVQQVGLHGPA